MSEKQAIQKLYCYVDESGQDTEGVLFLVSVVVTGEEREKMIKELLEIEKKSKKLATKWHKSRQDHRVKYLEEVFSRAYLFCSL